MPIDPRRSLLVAIACAAFAACKGGRHTETSGGDITGRWNPHNVATVHKVDAAALRTAIAARLEQARPSGLDEDHWKHVQRLYAHYANSPLWMNEDGLIGARVHALTNALVAAADSDALNVSEYPFLDLTNSVRAARADNATPEQLAQTDVLLTTSYAALAEDMLKGQRDPKTLKQAWYIPLREGSLDSSLARALVTDALDSSLFAMRPQDEGYAGLRKALVVYRGIATKGGWGSVPRGKALKPGQPADAARLQALRARLQAEGYQVDSASAVPNAAPRYDVALAGAVARYQSNHNIVADSVLGDSTIVSMNVPVEYRIQQIVANLERYRWMPRSLGTRYIIVNVPAFRLEAHDSTGKSLDMKVVVGQNYQDKTTPAFADSMQYVVFRPYWNVTPDIQSKEIEPKLASNPGYLDENDMEYYKDGGATRIRQRPGDKNSLGLVKFLFPNDFNIYFHDTPAKDLFDKDVRAFSHGCIRLEKPAELAAWALGWPIDKVEQAMHSESNNQQVTLPSKIPVYITYFTAYVDGDLVRFGNDLYDRDDVLVGESSPVGMPSDSIAGVIAGLRQMAGER